MSEEAPRFTWVSGTITAVMGAIGITAILFAAWWAVLAAVLLIPTLFLRFFVKFDLKPGQYTRRDFDGIRVYFDTEYPAAIFYLDSLPFDVIVDDSGSLSVWETVPGGFVEAVKKSGDDIFAAMNESSKSVLKFTDRTGTFKFLSVFRPCDKSPRGRHTLRAEITRILDDPRSL